MKLLQTTIIYEKSLQKIYKRKEWFHYNRLFLSSIELFWTIYEIDFKNIATNSYLILCKAWKISGSEKTLQEIWENHVEEVHM